MKLIAEPWDVGEGGYQVGNFPALWSEWNGKYRDDDPRLLAGRAEHTVAEFGYRFTGSRATLYSVVPTAARRPRAINFVTAHDGFTLARPRRPTTASTTTPTARATSDGDRATTARGTAGPKGPTDDPEQVNALRAPPAPQPADHADALGQGVPDAPRGR